MTRILRHSALVTLLLTLLLGGALLLVVAAGPAGAAVQITGPSDADSDGDGAPDAYDNCPTIANPEQYDDDTDGIGNVCDPLPRGGDPDGDGVGFLDDNCPSIPNPDQSNMDKDGHGDPCDTTPRGDDNDNDGVPLLDDKCPTRRGPPSNKGCPVQSPPNNGGGDNGSGDGGNNGGDNSGGDNGGDNSGGDNGGDNSGGDNSGGDKSSDNGTPKITTLQALVRKGRFYFRVRADRRARVEVRVQRRCAPDADCRWKTVRKRFVIVEANKTRTIRVRRLAAGTYRLRAYANSLSKQTSDSVSVSDGTVQVA